MIDILIKSFNRPYYLDRCIQSIYKQVLDTDFNIVVLDDGTPQTYLKQLKQKYPNVIFKTSNFYEEKARAIISNNSTGSQIPIKFWVEAAKNASEYFLLLEDDIWFTKPFYLYEAVQCMQSRNSIFMKLFWLGNANLIQSESDIKFGDYTQIQPGVPSFRPAWYRFVFYKFKRFKIRWINEKLNFNTLEKRNSYYSIYSVAGVVFRKDYFISLWSKNNNQVDEQLQIYNALKFIKKNGGYNSLTFFRTSEEVLKTGFSSSATDKSFLKKSVKMNMVNHRLNELWLQQQLDVMENYPKDFSEDYIASFFAKIDTTFSTSWKAWRKAFRHNYEKFGCNID